MEVGMLRRNVYSTLPGASGKRERESRERRRRRRKICSKGNREQGVRRRMCGYAWEEGKKSRRGQKSCVAEVRRRR